MSLAVALLLSAALQAAHSPPPVPEAEMFCVLTALDQPSLVDMADLVIGSPGDFAEISEIAAPAADKCAKQWKWDQETRSIAMLTAAARAALGIGEASLQPRFSHDQLRALYDRIGEQDVAALTIAGAAALPAEQRYSHRLRLEAIYKAAGAQPAEYYQLTEFVTAVARYQEMHRAWAGRAHSGKR